MANYLNKFVKHASIILNPLNELTSQKIEFEWTEIHNLAFNEFEDSPKYWSTAQKS